MSPTDSRTTIQSISPSVAAIFLLPFCEVRMIRIRRGDVIMVGARHTFQWPWLDEQPLFACVLSIFTLLLATHP